MATTCRERELTLDDIHSFLTTQVHGGPPGWVISSTPGPTPRQHEHARRYTSFTHEFILTRWIWKDVYDGQIIFGNFLVDLKLPDICLTGEEKPRKKKTPRKLVPIGDWTQARCVTGAHVTACFTAIEIIYIIEIKI